MTTCAVEGIDIDDVVITAALDSRPARETDPQRETQALRSLAGLMVDRGEEVLPKFVDLALDLCDCVAAGLSLYEPTSDGGIFRWRHLRGIFRRFEGVTTPRCFSPCGVTLDRHEPVLCTHPERYYSWIAEAGLTVPEVLLVPLYLGNDEPFGTLWVVAAQTGHFDMRHARTMIEIATLVSVALRLSDRPALSASLADMPEEQRLSALLLKLERFESLDAADRTALIGASCRRRTIRRGDVVAAEVGTTIAVESGFVGEYRTFRDRHRQIVRLHVSGDLLPVVDARLGFEALSDLEITEWSTPILKAAGRERPAIARALDCARVMGDAMFYRWVAVLGGRSANVRIAHFFYELYVRLRDVGLASNHGYRMPLTQQNIASICGLSLVHTNKTLRNGLFEIARFTSGQVEIADLDALRYVAEFDLEPATLGRRIALRASR